jgi:hypothetical protein
VYEDFVRISREIMRGRNTAQQKELVITVLMSLLPPGAPEQFRWGRGWQPAAAALLLGAALLQRPHCC